MSNVLEITNKQFKFDGDSKIDNGIYCLINVTVKKIKYVSNEIFYDIDFKHIYSSENSLCKNLNPLLNLEEKDTVYEGDIIVSNELTDIIVKYLLMSFEDLQKHSGRVTAQQYKKQIIKSINLFWD